MSEYVYISKEELTPIADAIRTSTNSSEKINFNTLVDYSVSSISNNSLIETDPTVPDWAKEPTKPTYTASEVGADPAGTAQAKVNALNVRNGNGVKSVVIGEGTTAHVRDSLTIGKLNVINYGFGFSRTHDSMYMSDSVIVDLDSIEPPSISSTGYIETPFSATSASASRAVSYFNSGRSVRLIFDRQYLDVDYAYRESGACYFEGSLYTVVESNKAPVFTIGNGTSDTARSNAHTTDWNGNAWYAGSIKIGGTGATDSAAKEVATKEYVETYVNETILGGEW